MNSVSKWKQSVHYSARKEIVGPFEKEPCPFKIVFGAMLRLRVRRKVCNYSVFSLTRKELPKSISSS